MLKSLLIFVLNFPLFLFGQTLTITDGLWSDPGIWTAGVPNTNSTAIITDNVFLDVNIDVGTGGAYAIDDGTITDIGGGFNMQNRGSGLLDIGGNVRIGGDLIMRNNSQTFIRACDTVIIEGDVNTNDPTNNSSLTIESCAVLIVKGDFEMRNNFSGFIDGQISVEGNFTGSNSAMMDGIGNIEIAGFTILNNGASLFGSTTSCPSNCEYGSGVGLPITLSGFHADFINENQILIEWETASEINNDYFIIEASENGYDFNEIDRVNGAGNSNKVENYQLLHHIERNSPLIYLRLTQVDFDGQSEQFPLIVVKRNRQAISKQQVSIYPNPTSGEELFMDVSNLARGSYQGVLMDMKGVELSSMNFYHDPKRTQSNGINLLETTPKLSKGLYFVKLIGKGESQMHKILVK